MNAGRGAILRARDLQEVLAGLLLGHAEFLDGRPLLGVSDGRARRELARRRLAIEPDRHLHMAATMQMQIGTRRLHKLEDDDVIIERRFTVFEKHERVGLAGVLAEQDFLDDGDGVIATSLDVLDFANAVALVEDVDGLHVCLFPRGCAQSGIALGLHFSDRGPHAKPESQFDPTAGARRIRCSLIAGAGRNWKGVVRGSATARLIADGCENRKAISAQISESGPRPTASQTKK